MRSAVAVTAENIGRLLKEERRNQGMGLSEFGGKIDIPAQSLSRYERGATEPNPRAKKKIADYFKLSVTDIWPVAFEEDAE